MIRVIKKPIPQSGTGLETALENDFYFVLQVLMPKSVYNGQKLTKLVNKNIAAKAIRMYARVPPITLK